MKKLIAVTGIAVMVFSLSSCFGKCAKCTTGGETETYCQGEYTQEEINQQQVQCELNQGNWQDA